MKIRQKSTGLFWSGRTRGKYGGWQECFIYCYATKRGAIRAAKRYGFDFNTIEFVEDRA